MAACASWQAAQSGDKLYQLTILSTACSILSTFLLIITVYLSYRATTSAIRATEISSQAMKMTLETAKIDLRPYIFHKSWNVRKLTDETEKSLISYRIEHYWNNYGRSIAHNETSSMRWQKFPKGKFPDDFDFPESTRDNPVSIGPDHGWFNHCVIPFSDVLEVHEGISEIHIWLSVEYDDGTESSKFRTEKHVTMAPMRKPGIDMTDFFLSDAKNFNGADEASFKKPA